MYKEVRWLGELGVKRPGPVRIWSEGCQNLHPWVAASQHAIRQTQEAPCCVQVTEQDLDDFEAKYRGSEEEKADVLKYYDQFSGDMDKVCRFLSEAMEAGSFWR